MFGIVSLLNVNYNILRSARNALVIADLGSGGAGSIPLFELIGTLPAAVIMVYVLTRLLNRFSIYKVFLIVLTIFLSFFLLFALFIYPFLFNLKSGLITPTWLPFSPSNNSPATTLFHAVFCDGRTLENCSFNTPFLGTYQ